MNTTTENPPATNAPAKPALKAAGKGKEITQPVQPAANPSPEAATETPRTILLKKVNDAIADCKGRSPAEQRAILNNAMATVEASCPNVVFSENKEQRTAQLNALREQRKNLGWQDCARLIGQAVAAIPGAEAVRTYAAQPMANGSLRAREVIVTTAKAPKGSGKRAVVIR